MNEYEEVIFLYIQENKMGKIYQRSDYRLVSKQESALFEAFYNSLTKDQRRKYRRYEEQKIQRVGIEDEVFFTETLTAVRALLTGGSQNFTG